MSLEAVSTDQRQSIEIRKKLEEKYSDETEELKALTKLILMSAPEYFADVHGITFRIFFSIKPQNDHAAYCKKLENSVRFKEGIDFYILIDKTAWDNSNRIIKAKLIIHELHHIGRDEKDNPAIRKHNERENFCELPSHDVFSDTVVLKIKDRLSQPILPEEISAT